MASNSHDPHRGAELQTTARVLMVRPAHFGSNPETAASNAFQRSASGTPEELLQRARCEFDGLVAALRSHGVEVHVIADTPEPVKLDAVFPNNWLSFHEDGTVVLYPLLAPSRRSEVRPEVLSEIPRVGDGPRRLLDLRVHAQGEFLEGTGSLVLDRVRRVAYACRSPRTSPDLLAHACRELAYDPVVFHATDARGVAVYHTNVMLSIGTRVALVCLDAIRDGDERRTVERRLRESGRELVAIRLAQMDEFAGNALELRARDGGALLVLSERARRALDPAQRAVLERHAVLVSSELATIEACGGGSARCMIAEIF